MKMIEKLKVAGPSSQSDFYRLPLSLSPRWLPNADIA